MKKLFVLAFVCVGFLAKSQSLCAGSALTLQAAPPASISPTSYTLLPGGFSSPTGAFVISPTITTTYTILTTGTTATAGIVTHTAVSTVTVFAQPSFAPTFTQTSCTSTVNGVNLGLTFSPQGPTPSYTISWQIFPPNPLPNIPNGITSSTQYSVIGSIAPTQYGALVQSAGGCSAIVNFTMLPQPAPANFSIVPGGSTFSITCYSPTVSLSTSDATYSYTWNANSLGQVVAPNIDLTSANVGSVVVVATNPVSGCTSSKTLTIGMNTLAPQSSLSPTLQNITCNLSSITTVSLYALTTTVNISHIITAPQGGSFVANTSTVSYAPQGGTGTYSYCLIDNVNGCSTCKDFSVTSNQGFPTFSLTSQQNFTIGCASKSLEVVNFINGNTTPPGGAVSYTLIAPNSPTATVSGTLTGVQTYSITQPGLWIAITKDNVSLCESRVPFSIIQNTAGPAFTDVIVPNNILTCDVKGTTLTAVTEAPNVAYNWAIPGTPVTFVASPNLSVNANFTVPATQTLLATYTITLEDVNSKCITNSLIPIYQNVYLPNIGIVATPTAFTCSTPTIVLSNQSTTGIPPNSIFPRNQPVSGWYWQGPSPMEPANVTSTYLGLLPGVYTLTGRDLNNGCTRTGTIELKDLRDFPTFSVTSSTNFKIECGDASATMSVVTFPVLASADYTWMPDVFNESNGNNNSIYKPRSTGVYSVLVSNRTNGCATLSGTFAVTPGTLVAAFDADKESGYAPLTVKLRNNSSYSNIDNSGITTTWNYANGLLQTTKDASLAAEVTFNQPGTYTIVAHAVKFPCMDTAIKIIRVEIPSKLQIPNVFTPNGDNVNDIYFLRTSNVSSIEMKIYDRWGHKIYELNSLTGNVAWDGKNQYGAECPDGTYFYIVNATGKDGKTWEEKGNISLIR